MTDDADKLFAVMCAVWVFGVIDVIVQMADLEAAAFVLGCLLVTIGLWVWDRRRRARS